jgi:asparagine synthase (glutamine-hydrolysing)
MLAATRFRAPDGEGQWSRAPVSLGHQLLATTPESRSERQPLYLGGPDLAVSFDGRIDNRPELLRALPSAAEPGVVLSDAMLALRAYERWGESCCSRLLGDFAFAIWDGRRQRLFAARDTAGIKPFYYAATAGGGFVFGSEPAQVLRHPAVSSRVNEGAVAECLVGRISSHHESLFADILRLPPGCCLTVNGSCCEVRRYWRLEPDTGESCARGDELLEQFLALLRSAVSDRLRGPVMPGVSLSGGLDSTAIAAMAQRLVAERGAGEQIEGYSLTVDLPGCLDETPWIDAAVARWGLRGHAVAVPAAMAAPDWVGQVRQSRYLPDYPTAVINQPLYQALRDRGGRVLLTGMGGNTWLGGSDYPYQDMIAQGALGAIVDELRYQARDRGWGFALSRLVRSLGWPLLPRTARLAIERSWRRSGGNCLISEEFARRTDLEQRLHSNDSDGSSANLARWEVGTHGTRAAAAHAFEMGDREDSRAGIECRHPFHDRRLVEFAAPLPSQFKRRAGHDRMLLLHSGLLPERHLAGGAQAEFSIAAYQALATETASRSLAGLAIAAAGWVDQRRVDALRASVRQPFEQLGPTQRRHLIDLWMVLAVELWFNEAV